MTDPLADWTYEFVAFGVAAWALLQRSDLHKSRWCVRVPLLAISLWGFGQLAWGTTVYRSATMNVSLKMAALGATALATRVFLRVPSIRSRFLQGFAWFGLLLATLSVLAYFTSPGQILWMFTSPYPDVWGPFLSRNNFAQFLELVLPVALWLALGEPSVGFLWIPAVILAAGLASASRAGAAILIVEAVVVFLLMRPIRWRSALPVFTVATLGTAVVAGAGTLLGRLSDQDPLRFRREIFQSTAAMIADHPWQGFGLGSYRAVYPEFAKFDSGAVVEHAHNDWLEWAAEGGLPFAAVWAVLALFVLRPAIRSIWGLGVVAVFLHAVVDDPLSRFGISAWTFILIGALENTPDRFALTHRRIT